MCVDACPKVQENDAIAEKDPITCATCLTVMTNLKSIPLPLQKYDLTSDNILSKEACYMVDDYFEAIKCKKFVEKNHTFLILSMVNYGSDLTCSRLNIC